MVHSVEEYECADTSIKDGKVVAQHNEYSRHSTPSTPLQVDIYTNPFTGRYIPTPFHVEIYQPLQSFTGRYVPTPLHVEIY